MTTTGSMQTLTLSVEGMNCGNCAKHVEKALTAADGVERAAVDLTAKNVVITFDSTKATLASLAAAVDDAGYTLILPGQRS